jgi:branched-chain amino acid transport system ATP-binding protein
MFAEIQNISVYYNKSLAVEDVTINVPEAGVVSIIGANGAGKSTILKSLLGLVPIREGDIVFEGESISGLETAARVKKGIALVPEGRQLFPYLSVITNLKLGATVRRDRAGISESLEYVFELFPRLKERLKQNAGTLSGGEQQMLAIGRGLMANPRLLC